MSSFPSMISNEPPPLEMSSEEEDSEEFRTPGLKLDVASAEPSPISTPLKKSLQRSSSPGKGESAISDITSQAERPSDIKVTNGHFLEEELPSSGKRPSLQGQSSEEAGLKTPGSTSETGPHSTPSSPSDQEFSDCQNHEFDYDLSTTDPVLSSSPKKQELTMEFASSANAIDETAAAAPVEVSRPNEIHQVICDTSNTVVDEEASDFKDTVEKITEENIYTSNRLDKDSLVNELTDSVENMNVGSQQNTGDKPESSVNRDSPAVHAEFSEAVSSNNLPIADEVEDSEDFGDFEAFPVSSFVSSDQTTDSSQNNHTNNEMKTSYIGEVNDEEDDGFGDFASTPRLEASTDCFPSTSNSKEPVVFNNELLAQPQSTQLDDDDFADFQDFQDAPSTSQAYSEPHPNPKIPSRSTSFSQSFSSPRMSADFTAALESKFDLLIKNVIPKDASQSSNQTNRTEEQSEDENREVVSEYNSIDKEIQGSSDTCWTHVQDFEESKGLLYKWLNSLSQQRMYKSLKIDASNIVYTQKWGAIEVPKFAASMVETPILQPQVFSNSSPVTESVRKSSVPTPDDASNSAYKKAASKEARQILQQIPDISFMTAKTIVFPQTNRTAANSLL